MINFRVKKFSQERPLTALALIVRTNFRKINFRSRHRLRKYFYNENFQIYSTSTQISKIAALQAIVDVAVIVIFSETFWLKNHLLIQSTALRIKIRMKFIDLDLLQTLGRIFCSTLISKNLLNTSGSTQPFFLPNKDHQTRNLE